MRVLSVAARLPGAPVLLPLAAGAVVGTWRPAGGGMGPFTGAVTGGAYAYITILLICVGAQITPASLRPVAGRVGIILTGATVVTGAAVLAYGVAAGPDGIAHVSPLAVAAVAVSTSPAMWLAIARRHGTAPDGWAGSVASTLNSAPVVPILLLLAISHHTGTVAWRSVLDATLPLAIGAAAGHLAPGCRTMLRAPIPVLVVLVAFSLGCRLDLHFIARQTPTGLVLGVVAGLVSGGLVVTGWRLFLHQPGTVGWAATACTITAPLLPAIAATTDPTWTPYVPAATAQAGVALIVTTLAAPALTAFSARHHARRQHHLDPGGAGSAAQPVTERARLATLTAVDQSP
ncbi:2-keto-3-deoxygluconate permease [Actinocatenispora rupis]|uniref:2-keto-3-deoxygluconate permease n=1 Tax=Actinocatenispora rupis TaxID=519421 RepID=A0A8J3JDU4_9ACTN|nr:2-keto-3-deoxygluconate permease [Actinocatenispora rupis]GID14889.1 hypothetical protein Aru02nite_57780 [Actinocatenispora rupis]